MADVIKAWQCIGCGRIEAPQQCVGICQDRKIEMVDVRAHAAELGVLQARLDKAEAVLRQIAFTTPHAGEFEQAWLAIGRRARLLLDPDKPAS